MFGDKMKLIQNAVNREKEKPLLRLANKKDKNIRLAAIAGLGKVGKDDGFNLLVTLLSNPDADIRAAAALALGDLKNAHGKSHLQYRLGEEKDPKVLVALKQSIMQIGHEQ